jgi:hypothetical protein
MSNIFKLTKHASTTRRNPCSQSARRSRSRLKSDDPSSCLGRNHDARLVRLRPGHVAVPSSSQLPAYARQQQPGAAEGTTHEGKSKKPSQSRRRGCVNGGLLTVRGKHTREEKRQANAKASPRTPFPLRASRTITKGSHRILVGPRFHDIHPTLRPFSCSRSLTNYDEYGRNGSNEFTIDKSCSRHLSRVVD